ncbi:uncharacterized protein [Euphorbia lathyris]|uniref:uncharacterized protein isoform X3 n=1 Tax=Euphorbia lathyris TaxID=212925 RepID=UPI0033135366
MAPGRGRNNLRSNMVSISTNETPQLPPIVPAQSPLFSTSLPGRSVATLTSEANSDTSLENVVTNSTIPAPTDNEFEKTRGRGKAKGFEVKKRMKGGNKIDGVVIVKEDAKKNPPEDVTQDDWTHLCNHFEMMVSRNKVKQIN